MTTVMEKTAARDVMTRQPVCVESWMTIRELARIFGENDISGAPVIDGLGRVVGLVSKTDLIRQCLEGTGNVLPAYLFETLSATGAEDRELTPESSVRVEDFMTQEPVTVRPETSVHELAMLMFTKRIHRVIVTDEDARPVGIITSLDLIGAFQAEPVDRAYETAGSP